MNMKLNQINLSVTLKTAVLLLTCMLFIANIHAQDKSKLTPAYKGVVEFATGGFGGYNAPKTGDSILVYLNKSDKITIKIFPSGHQNQLRTLSMLYEESKLIKKEQYYDIVSFDKKVATDSYSFKYESTHNGGDTHSIQLVVMGDGDIACIYLQDESSGFIYDMLMGNLVKTK